MSSDLSAVNAQEMRAVLAGTKNESLGPHLARDGFWMRRKLYIYLDYLCNVFYEQREYWARYVKFSMFPSQPVDPSRTIRTRARWEEKRATWV